MNKTLCALLVLAHFGAANYQPKNDLLTLPASRPAKHAKTVKTLSFSGYTWIVTSSEGKKQGPGPNNFDSGNAWVDDSGYLHLKITRNAVDNTWHCAEVTLAQNLGYGTYQWNVDAALDSLDRNVVFGMFNYSKNDGFDEMDIEYSKWGHEENDKMLNYTLYPNTGSDKHSIEVVYPFTLSGSYTTQRLIRTSNYVTFKSIEGFHDDDKNVFASKTWTSSQCPVSTLDMPVMMNLWLFHGVTPANNKEVEIVIHSFKFTPL